jgi:hypothetical protein
MLKILHFLFPIRRGWLLFVVLACMLTILFVKLKAPRPSMPTPAPYQAR